MSSSLFIIYRHHRYIYFHCFLSLLLSLQNHEIHELDIYTQYLISIQVFNPEGIGPATNVVVMTDEGSKYKLFITLFRTLHRRQYHGTHIKCYLWAYVNGFMSWRIAMGLCAYYSAATNICWHVLKYLKRIFHLFSLEISTEACRMELINGREMLLLCSHSSREFFHMPWSERDKFYNYCNFMEGWRKI